MPRSVVGLLSDIDSAGDIAPVGELPARVAGVIGQATPQGTDGQPSGPCDGLATVPTALTDGLDIAAALRHVRPTVLSPWSEARNPNPMATPTTLTRITFDPDIMGGKACIRGLRVTVGTIIGLLAAGRSPNEIVQAYPYLEREDIDEALAYAAWRLEEREVPLAGAWRSSS